MMYGREDSDSAIVASKSANKVEGATAEPMKRRVKAEGKVITSATCRTQARESVSPGLDRLRQTVRDHRKEKLTALLHHVDVDLLTKAYHSIKRGAAVGVDGVTWEAYGEGLHRSGRTRDRGTHVGDENVSKSGHLLTAAALAYAVYERSASPTLALGTLLGSSFPDIGEVVQFRGKWRTSLDRDRRAWDRRLPRAVSTAVFPPHV
jgi:hypothetical protein